MKTIIAGSRNVTDFSILSAAILKAKREGLHVTEIVSGTARGVDQLGEQYARQMQLPLHRFPADWKKYDKRAGVIRNIEMAENAQALIAIWDGKSKGTKHMINIATSKGLKIVIFQPKLDSFNAYIKLGINKTGRDFVVGDIHGAYDLVLQAMEEVNFDPARDRLFSVGDLIDRGPQSHRCVRFLSQPYVYAIRGNHEDLLIDLYKDEEPTESILRFMAKQVGLEWWLDASDEMRQDVLDVIRKLPFVIETDTLRGTVGFVHADVPLEMNWQAFIEKIKGMSQDTVKTALWGRKRLSEQDQKGISGIGRLFVGHTPQWEGMKRFGNVYAIDTGAVFGELGIKESGRLTMVNIVMGTCDLSGLKDYRLVDVRNEEICSPNPFGNYATK